MKLKHSELAAAPREASLATECAITCAPIGHRARSSGAHRAPPLTCGGYTIIECLVYGLVLWILLGVAYAAFYQCVENSVRLRRNADDIASALQAGERWRADVRAASGPIRLEKTDAEQILRLPGDRGEVAYHFTTNAILRRVDHGAWTRLLNHVQSSAMESDPRSNVTAWRWELELKPRSKRPGPVRPLFTFLAVPERVFAP